MKATRNGWTIEGTPEEIRELIEMSASSDTFKVTTSPAVIARPNVAVDETKGITVMLDSEKADKSRQKNKIDWAKAESLNGAGWSFKMIAEEMGISYNTVYAHFNPVKKPGKEG